MALMAIDAGSSRIKVLVVSDSGELLATATKGYGADRPGPDMVEVNPEVFYRTVVSAVREAAGKTGVSIRALAVSSHGETFFPVDRHGNPVGPAVMNSDGRAHREALWWQKRLGNKKIYEITGTVVHPMYAVPKIGWLRKHRPEIFAAAGCFPAAADFILMRMGMPAVTDYSLASRLMAFDVRRRCWSDEILKTAGLSADRFSEPVPAGTAVGKLSPSVAAELGLKPGTVVAIAGHDQPCGALGAGAVSAGTVTDSAGTYECLTAVSDQPFLDRTALSYSLNSYCHVVPDKYVTLAFFPSGIMVRWFLEQLAGREAQSAAAAGEDPHFHFETRAPSGPTGLYVTPYLIGSCNPYWNPKARATIAGLDPASDLYRIYKGILEGIACEFSLNAGVLARVAGGFSEVRIMGGGANSALGLKLRAGLSGKSIQTLCNPESVCLGAAIMAGVACGVYSNAAEAVKKLVKVEATVAPDPEIFSAYSAQVSRYNRMAKKGE